MQCYDRTRYDLLSKSLLTIDLEDCSLSVTIRIFNDRSKNKHATLIFRKGRKRKSFTKVIQ